LRDSDGQREPKPNPTGIEADRRNLEVIPLVLQQYLRLWFRDLEDAMATPPPPGDVGEDMEEAFALYRRAKKLVDMGNAFLE
jgi:hypothetical protein